MTVGTPRWVAASTGGTVGLGVVKVSVNYAGPTLVPGPEAKKLDDYHLHYFLDEDANGFVQPDEHDWNYGSYVISHLLPIDINVADPNKPQ